jgi:hypothetical protein
MWRWCAIQQSYAQIIYIIDHMFLTVHRTTLSTRYKIHSLDAHTNQNTVPKRTGTDCYWKLLFWLCEGQNVQTHCKESLWPQFQLPKARHRHLNHSNSSKNICWELNYNARKPHYNQYRFLQVSLELFTHVSLEVEDSVLASRYGLYRTEEKAKNVAFSILLLLLGVMNSMSNHHRNPAVWRIV